jgi:hypothetical protein
MQGFRVYTPLQPMLVAALTLLSVGESVMLTLYVAALTFLAISLWSLVKYLIEYRKWNKGTASNGQRWHPSGRTTTIATQYVAGDQTYWFVHFDPSTTKICWLR